jgi:hypothetical protein
LFRDVVTPEGPIDPGYLLLLVIAVLVLGAIPAIVTAGAVQQFYSPEHRYPVQEVGIAIGAICGGCGPLIGGVGLFRAGDKEKTT